MSPRLTGKQRHALRWFIEQWEPLGYRAEMGSSGHWRITDPDGVYVATASSSPKNSRSAEYENGRLLRRHEEQRQRAAREDTP